MIGNKYQRKLIEYRKSNGLCRYCGRPLDREGTSCRSCCDKRNESTNKMRSKRMSQGLCPRCGKNKLFGDEKRCIECTYYESQITSSGRDRETYNKNHREWEKRKNEELRAKGICYRCKKRKAEYGFKTCCICRQKNAKYYQAKYSKPDRAENQYSKGLCFFCDNPLKQGYRVCEKHYQMNCKKANLPQTKEARKKMSY